MLGKWRKWRIPDNPGAAGGGNCEGTGQRVSCSQAEAAPSRKTKNQPRPNQEQPRTKPRNKTKTNQEQTKKHQEQQTKKMQKKIHIQNPQ